MTAVTLTLLLTLSSSGFCEFFVFSILLWEVLLLLLTLYGWSPVVVADWPLVFIYSSMSLCVLDFCYFFFLLACTISQSNYLPYCFSVGKILALLKHQPLVQLNPCMNSVCAINNEGNNFLPIHSLRQSIVVYSIHHDESFHHRTDTCPLS